MGFKAILPHTIPPMLATASKEPFDSPEFSFEVKWDGIRCLAFLEAETRLQSRNLNDISYRYPELGDLHEQVRGQPAVLDGEIVVLRDGKPSFEDLQKRDKVTLLNRIPRAARERPAVFVTFDLLYWKGQRVTGFPLTRRRQLLEEITEENETLVISRAIRAEGVSYCKAVFAQGLEGVMAKRLDSAYLPGKRTRNWLKLKRMLTVSAIIGGYTPGRQGSHELGSLVLGLVSPEGPIRYVGHAGTGFTRLESARLVETLNASRTTLPALDRVPREVASKAVWCRPQWTCKVEFLELTGAGRLRHAAYRGLSDLPVSECTFAQLNRSPE